jgi:sulfur carrier protein
MPSGATTDHGNDEAIGVRLNGEPRELRPGTTVEDVISLISPEARGVAVAVNGDVVPRSAWAATTVAAGDRLEVLTAAQGG